jgi:5-methyltetrahydropteroyltriglutamate--homocysteine methyltransferase
MKNNIPSEQIGSIPRSQALIDAYHKYMLAELDLSSLNELAEQETIKVIHELEALGCSVMVSRENLMVLLTIVYIIHQLILNKA